MKTNDLKTVKIGNQVWMAENLNVDLFRNGDPISEVKSNEEWERARKRGKPAWCYYNNNPKSGKKYGKLYNWYAVSDLRGLAPEGWHIPNREEWVSLFDYLGGKEVAGGKLKEAGTTNWHSPNKGATNESGFSALPGGYRLGDNGIFGLIGDSSQFWSATEYSINTAEGTHFENITFKKII